MRVPPSALMVLPLLASWTSTSAQTRPPDCRVAATIFIPAERDKLGRPVEASKRAYRLADGSVMFVGRFTVDADGSPRAYHPQSRLGQDNLGNAGRPGNWWALATDTVDRRGRATCKRSGRPIVQGPDDPAPGFHVSKTAMVNPAVRSCRRPGRYVDSDVIPYAAMPAAIASVRGGEGPLVAALAPGRDDPVFALHADQPPAYGVGEGSMELARRLGLNPDPRRGGTRERAIVWLVMPTTMGFPRSAAEVEQRGAAAFDAWGGSERLRACAAVVRNLPR